jgi:hypothetical protein
MIKKKEEEHQKVNQSEKRKQARSNQSSRFISRQRARISSQAREIVEALQAVEVFKLDPDDSLRRRPHLPAVAAGRAAADRDDVRSPRLAHCAEGRGCYWDVGGDVAVLGVRLCDGDVFCLCDGFGDGGNARGDANFGGSEGRGMRDCGLFDADVVN